MLEINESKFKMYDITTARGEIVKEYVESKDPAEANPHNQLLFKDNVDYNMVATLTSGCDTSAEPHRCPFTEGSRYTRHIHGSDAGSFNRS